METNQEKGKSMVPFAIGIVFGVIFCPLILVSVAMALVRLMPTGCGLKSILTSFSADGVLSFLGVVSSILASVWIFLHQQKLRIESEEQKREVEKAAWDKRIEELTPKLDIRLEKLKEDEYCVLSIQNLSCGDLKHVLFWETLIIPILKVNEKKTVCLTYESLCAVEIDVDSDLLIDIDDYDGDRSFRTLFFQARDEDRNLWAIDCVRSGRQVEVVDVGLTSLGFEPRRFC